MSIPFNVFAHAGIPTQPVTACEDLDSTNLTTHTINQISERMASASPTTDWKLFSTSGTGAGTTYVRNASVWTNNGDTDIDWTGISPYNTSGGYYAPGTLVSPRHMIMANHYAPAVGAKIVFVDNENNVYERTLSQTAYVGNDILVGLLDSDVPDSITYYPVMSTTTLASALTEYYPKTLDVPIIVFDQEKKALIHSMVGVTGSFGGHYAYFTGPYSIFSESVVSGDSGNPNFIIIDGQPILLGSHYTSVGFPNLGYHIDEVNSAMTTLGGGYQLTEYNPFSCFDNYSPINTIPAFGDTGNISSFTINQHIFSPSTVLKTYSATDVDAGQSITYSLRSLSSNATTTAIDVEDYFSVDFATGELRQTSTIDTSLFGQVYTLTIRATDDGAYPAYKDITNQIDIYDRADGAYIEVRDEFISTSTNQTGIRALTPAPNGDLYLASNNYGLEFRGSSNEFGITKIKADGTIDMSYSLNQGTGVLTPSGVPIVDAFIDDQSRVLFVGSFAGFNGFTAANITRLLSDGSVDADFMSNIGTGGSGGTIGKVLELDDGMILAGSLTSFNGVTSNRLVKLNTEGVVDTDFASALGSGFNSLAPTLTDIMRYSDSQFMVSGNFTSFNGSPATRIARFNNDGTFDNDFQTAIGTGPNTNITHLAKLSDGRIVASGSFTLATFNGTSIPKFVVLNADGTIDTAFMANVGTGPNNAISSIVVLRNDRIVLGGTFTTFNGVAASDGIYALNSDGTPATDFMEALGLGYDGDTTNMSIIEAFEDNKLVIHGNYSSYNGISLRGPHILQAARPEVISDFTLSASSDSGQYDDDLITNSETTTFSGEAMPLGKVYVKDEDDTLGEVTADEDGVWSLDLNLEEGIYSMSAFQVNPYLDNATSSDSISFDVEIDRTAPRKTTSLSVYKTVIVSFDEDFATSSASSVSDWVVSENGAEVSISSVAILESDVYLILNGALSEGTSISVSYIGNGLEDVAGNVVATFSSLNSTNGTVSESSSEPTPSPTRRSGGGGGGGGGNPLLNVSSDNNGCMEGGLFSITTGLRCVSNESVSSANETYKFGRSLTLGASGDDVLSLQRFLNRNGYTVSITGSGSLGQETRYFGLKTRSALARFQAFYGIKPALGYFGPITQRFISSRIWQ